MKTYIERTDSVELEGMFIPKDLANRDYQIVLKEIANGQAELQPYEPPPKTLNQAIELGEAYISAKGFTPLVRQEITAAAALGFLSEAQLTKAQATLGWIFALKGAAIANPANFVPAGEPPYTPEQIMSE
jgi:hypothetical protein